MAGRLETANQALIELKRQVQTGQPRGMIDKTVEKMELLVGATYPVTSLLKTAEASPSAKRSGHGLPHHS